MEYKRRAPSSYMPLNQLTSKSNLLTIYPLPSL